MREAHYEEGVVLVGFGGYQGSVIASDRLGGATQAKTLPPARSGSTESLLHDSLGGVRQALFVFGDEPAQWATEDRPHRAVGVVFQASAERWGNYVGTTLGRRYDAFLWFDQTTALTPLHGVHEKSGEKEAWPSGL